MNDPGGIPLACYMKKTGVIPWNILDTASNIFRYNDETAYVIFGHDAWDNESLSDFIDKLLRFTAGATVVYVSKLVPHRRGWSNQGAVEELINKLALLCHVDAISFR